MNEELLKLYSVYESGAMTPDEMEQFEADQKAGLIPPKPIEAVEVDPRIQEAYQSGKMSDEEKAQFEDDLLTGKIYVKPKQEGFFASIGEKITGTERATEETQQLPDWAGMPEMNSFSLASFKSALGTMLTNPEETVQVIQANFPGVQARKDEKGNLIMTSSIDGKEYAIKPGFQLSDVPRAAGALAAFTPAGRAQSLTGSIIGAGATQAAIEGSQAATGGTFDPGEIPLAGLAGGGGFLAGKALQSAGQAAKRLFTGGKEAPTPPPAPLAQEEAVKTVQEVAEGSTRAKQVLAQQAAPDKETIEAAKRLGVDEFLQPDHVSTNQVYREISQAVKSIPGSEARAAELEGLEQVARKADDIIDEIGGYRDMSQLNVDVKEKIKAVQADLGNKANELYEKVAAHVPKKAQATVENITSYITGQAEDMGGMNNLKKAAPQVYKLFKQLNPEDGSVVTYGYLDRIRKALTAARVKKQGVFKDMEVGEIKALEKHLMADQKAMAKEHGVLAQFELAQKTVAMRKGVEDDLTALFGKTLEGSMLGKLESAMKKLPVGDTTKFIQLMKAIPEEIRGDVVASGLNTAFGKTVRNQSLNFTSFARWYEGLAQNKQAYAALMANLSPAARKQLRDLYKVSSGISKASRERITTGRLQTIKDELKGADTLIGNIYSLVKRSTYGAAAEAVTTPLGAPGAGLAAGIASALTKGKTDVARAADKVLASGEFMEMAKNGTEAAAKKLAKSPPFRRFMNYINDPRIKSAPERWILDAFQAQRQFETEQKGK